MIVGLMRHYHIGTVPGTFPLFFTPQDFLAYLYALDQTQALLPAVRPAVSKDFETCMTSDLPRALDTARHAYHGPAILIPELRELPVSPVTSLPVRLPLWLWLGLGRLAWLAGHGSQLPAKQEYLDGIRSVTDRILDTGCPSLLVVSHGISLYFLRRELRKRGFKGPGRRIPARGEVLLYER